MEPFTMIAAATGIVRALGLDDKLGRMLGGEKGAAIAKKVVDVAGVVTGGQDPASILEQLEGNAQRKHELTLALLRIVAEAEAADYKDRADARAMQVAALGQDDKFSKRFVYWFAGMWSIFAMVFLIGITFWPVPESSQQYANTAVGFIMGTVMATIIAYFFGSSHGSKDKDGAMSRMIETMRDKP